MSCLDWGGFLRPFVGCWIWLGWSEFSSWQPMRCCALARAGLVPQQGFGCCQTAGTASGLCLCALLSLCTFTAQAGAAWGVWRGHSCSTRPKLTKGYSIPDDVMFYKKSSVKRVKKKGALLPYWMCWSWTFQQVDIYHLANGKHWINATSLLAHAAFVFPVKVSLTWSTYLLNFLLLSSHHTRESEQVGEPWLARASPPQPVLLPESVSGISGHTCSRSSSPVWFWFCWFVLLFCLVFFPPSMHRGSVIQWSTPYLLLPLWSVFGCMLEVPGWMESRYNRIREQYLSNIFKAQSYVLLLSRKCLRTAAGSLWASWSAWYFWLKRRLITLEVATICINKKEKILSYVIVTPRSFWETEI